jgi:hypothetical protein
MPWLRKTQLSRRGNVLSLPQNTIVFHTQSFPGGKFNILGGHSISHNKQEYIYMYMCPIPNGFRGRAISLYSSKIGDKKEILRTVSNTGIYCSSDEVGTVYLNF